jgi:hypothetical protein
MDERRYKAWMRAQADELLSKSLYPDLVGRGLSAALRLN